MFYACLLYGRHYAKYRGSNTEGDKQINWWVNDIIGTEQGTWKTQRRRIHTRKSNQERM